MAAALNVFKTITANLTTSGSSLYSTPIGYSTVVLMMQVANISGNLITVSGYHVRSGAYTAIVTGAQVPSNDSLNLLTGRMILQYGDSLNISANANSSGQLILSLLETAT